MLFKRKHEFRPDKERSGALSKLYITKKQRLKILKWLLMAFTLVILSVLQDVILSRVSIFGGTTDLIPCALLIVCIMLGPEVGSVFVLIASSLYYFSGSAPGPYVILILTALGIFIAILRQNFLRYSFGSVLLCASVGILVYELVVFFIGLFLGFTTMSRLSVFLITGGVSIAAIPLLYPIFTAIGKIGGETWKE